MNDRSQLEKDLQKLSNPQKAVVLARFFKTGKGEYGEGDKFLGITVPEQRTIARKYPSISLEDIRKLLLNKIHEYRLTALIILVNKYKKSNKDSKQKIFDFYLSNTKNINNWDLVDLSAPNIIGDYLMNRDKSILYKLARSSGLWEKRISILSTLAFIKNNEFEDTLKIAEILLEDKHDLIHKAVGWMLRELGKKDQVLLENFLKKYCQKMPRVMLRYAVERFEEEKRRRYLNSA